MSAFRVSLIGHRIVDNIDEIEQKVSCVAKNVILKNEYTEFYIGRNGDFDIIAASCIKKVQSELNRFSSSIFLVLPYTVSNLEYYEKYYNAVIIPDELSAIHPKSAITKRNEWLISHSDLLIAYVVRSSDGAATCLKKAVKAELPIILL